MLIAMIGSPVVQFVHLMVLGVRLGSLAMLVMHLVVVRMMVLASTGLEECLEVLIMTIGSPMEQLVHLLVLGVRLGSLEVWVMHLVVVRMMFWLPWVMRSPRMC